MFYADSQRTVTRRDSSIILPRKHYTGEEKHEFEALSTARGPTYAADHFISESAISFIPKAKGSVRKELVTMLFESMLDNIVESWEVIIPQKHEESFQNMEFMKTPSELMLVKGKKKMTNKPAKSKRSRSKMDMNGSIQVESFQQSWWSAPDEKAIIRFRNGNVYEGSISMKSMHGDGRFQWADGTTYLGQFKDNAITGKGRIRWKDDTWYEGEFSGNIRHGRGLYVDSREQRSYGGEWSFGTKNGEGAIYFSKSFKDSYDGQWEYNMRHGYGSREYSESSGFKGEWDMYIRKGKGLMIWPSGDFYRGDWKNNVMSGYGIYIWEAYYNNTMSLPSINIYRGQWSRGERNGFGILNLGLGLGSHYNGEFKNNKKHGVGKFVTNNGLILKSKDLFTDDNLTPIVQEGIDQIFPHAPKNKIPIPEPLQFNICDSSVGLHYHIDKAIRNIDKQKEIRLNIIKNFLKYNKSIECIVPLQANEKFNNETTSYVEDLVEFEETSLWKALKCYETELKKIYDHYATVCNTESISFTPILIRLYLWQFYYDCNIHEKGLTLVEVNRMFHENPTWLSKSTHDPFEKIYFWQFFHSLITVADRLYAKKHLPSIKPDTILASAFRQFMDKDVLPNAGSNRGSLTSGYGTFVPLLALYNLYKRIGDPHTVRDYICAIRRAPHWVDQPQPPLRDEDDSNLPIGRNTYVFGDEMTFIVDDTYLNQDEQEHSSVVINDDLMLFNFGNLSSKFIVNMFSKIFQQMYKSDKIVDLDIELTFFEFFQAFIACTEESIRVKNEEIKWREKFAMESLVLTGSPKSK